MNIIFTAAVLYIAKEGRVVPDSLIAAWFSFTTGELWILSGIRKTKLKSTVDAKPMDNNKTS